MLKSPALGNTQTVSNNIMETIKYIWENETIRYIVLVILIILILTFLMLLRNHLIKTKKGEYSKFFWVENKEKINHEEDENKSNKIKGKNINTGNNYGKIGDN